MELSNGEKEYLLDCMRAMLHNKEKQQICCCANINLVKAFNDFGGIGAFNKLVDKIMLDKGH